MIRGFRHSEKRFLNIDNMRSVCVRIEYRYVPSRTRDNPTPRSQFSTSNKCEARYSIIANTSIRSHNCLQDLQTTDPRDDTRDVGWGAWRIAAQWNRQQRLPAALQHSPLLQHIWETQLQELLTFLQTVLLSFLRNKSNYTHISWRWTCL
jgi:hypothetical protein